jgi:hypothetical protein
MKLPHSRLMFVEFERIFAQFDYDSYNKIISDRTKNSLGNDKASDLIIEIAKISSYFVSDKIRKKINPNASVYMAFYGWTLSDEKVFSNKDYCKLDKYLKKNISSCAKTVAYESDYTNKTEICWIIFCCAMIKSKFYSEHTYQFQSMTIDSGFKENGDMIKIAYTH